MNKTTFLVALVVGLLLVLGAVLNHVHVWMRSGTEEEETTGAMKAVDQFHARLSTGQFDAIFHDADPAFQSQDRAKLLEAMHETQTHYGSFKRVTFSQLNVVIGAPIQIRAVYNSTFTNGDTTELFTFVDREGEIRLLEYQISPGTVKPANH